MPSRRDLIRMTPEEIRSYLRSQPRIIVVSNGPDGLPHPVPMNFALDDADRIIITTFRKSQKVKNLERDPRATLLVESGIAYAELKSVMAYARAEIIDDPTHIREAVRALHWTTPLPVSADPVIQGQITESFAKRVIVRFSPFKYVSWDHSKLGGRY
jgi:nitroimidazol reductase NimA-like FMN-containing flavoprotein (pyridoxamine 5'-phosphate oxidase superfamily)